VLPILYVLLAAALVPLWRRSRVPVVALAALSVAINLPTASVNVGLVLDESPSRRDEHAPWPYQQAGVWRAFLMGLQGRPLPAPDSVVNDPVRSAGTRFPDFWTAHLMRESRPACLCGLLFLGPLLAAAAWALARIVRGEEPTQGADACRKSSS
jgi:hypothetical protein